MFFGDTEKKSPRRWWPHKYEDPKRDLESMCQFCKNEDTKRLIGDDDLRIKDYFGEIKQNLCHTNFRAYHCMLCGGFWWHKTKS